MHIIYALCSLCGNIKSTACAHKCKCLCMYCFLHVSTVHFPIPSFHALLSVYIMYTIDSRVESLYVTVHIFTCDFRTQAVRTKCCECVCVWGRRIGTTRRRRCILRTKWIINRVRSPERSSVTVRMPCGESVTNGIRLRQCFIFAVSVVCSRRRLFNGPCPCRKKILLFWIRNACTCVSVKYSGFETRWWTQYETTDDS